MNWAALFTSLVSPLVLRAIAALSMSVVTFTGVDTALNALITQAQSSWSGMSADVMGLAGLAGVPAALGIIAGAMTARVSIWVAASAAKWIVK
jgi:hypothetical protein